jgi:Uma2 family endonuclease
MVETGILSEHDRVELIRGEIVQKITVGPAHAACVNALNRILGELLTNRAVLSIQNPVRLPQSVPEPDVALLVPRADQYRKSLPTGADVLLVIEVADSPLIVDRSEKLLDYAEAGIAEYWIVNLIGNVVEVYRQPQANGTYHEPLIAKPGETLTPVAFPDVAINVADILG